MKNFLILFVVIAVLSCGVGRKAATATDHAILQGAWLAQTESQNGSKKEVSYRYVFSGDTLTFTEEPGKDMQYLFSLDTTATPRLLIIRPVDTADRSAPVSVAYELSGDSLTIVVAPAGLTPTTLSDSNDQELITCKRKLK